MTKLPLRGSDAPFKFLIKSIKGEFIDPNNIVLYLKFKILRKGAGGELKKLEETENVAPYSGFFYTMFKVREVNELILQQFYILLLFFRTSQ